MTNREKLISHYTKWLKSLNDRDLVFTIELCAETEFCCKHCVFSNKGKQCGSTTVSTLLSKTLGIELINYTFRQLAQEKGLTLSQVIENAKTDDSYDKYVDSHQVFLAEKSSCVLGSRLAIWMLKNADLKIYLKLDDDTRAERIYNREGGDLQQIKEFTKMLRNSSRLPTRKILKHKKNAVKSQKTCRK